MIFDRYNYVVCLKTTDAELKGLKRVADHPMESTLPLLELTKSRITSRNPIGTIHRRIEQIEEILGDHEFFLDLVTHDDLMNIEIEDLFDESNGYERWCNLASQLDWARLVPVVQILDGGDPVNIRRQASRLTAQFGRVGFRYDVGATDLEMLLEPVCDGVGNTNNLVVLLDARFVRTNEEDLHIPDFLQHVDTINRMCTPSAIVTVCSSFPKSVTSAGYGRDDEGSFSLAEIQLSSKLIDRMPDARIFHGDYGLVHPIRYPGGGGWIPRVDVPLEEECFYHRFRREDGGYVRAAQEVLDDEFYTEIGAWGEDEIAAAAAGRPNGRSPAHWIAVRVNLHITRQHHRLS